MLSVDEARARILAPLRATSTELVGLAEAWSRVLASPVVARLTQPPTNMSAMDGYAVRAEDCTAGSRLTVIGSAPAGHPFSGTLRSGEAVRLFTGSVVPDGADTILLQEDADSEGDTVEVRETCPPGRHIRLRGQDFLAGDTLLQPGRQLGSRDIGLAAAANYPWLTVHRRPRVAILATGDEISMPGEPVSAGGIVSSNAHALAALVRARGGDPVLLPVAADDRKALAALIDQVRGMHILVTTGGASVGEHDLVQAALGDHGFELDFWKIAMRPGKPLIAGRVFDVPVLGLPGNPVSAYVCAILFLLPAIDLLAGRPAGQLSPERAILGVPLKANDARADYLRSTLVVREDGASVISPFSRQDSGMFSVLARADALLLRPPFAAAAESGSEVEMIRLDHLCL